MTDEELFQNALETLTYELQASRSQERSLRISATMVTEGADTELEWEEAVGIFKMTQRLIGGGIAGLRRLGLRIGKTYDDVDALISDIEIRVYTDREKEE